jgi:ribosomal protein L20
MVQLTRPLLKYIPEWYNLKRSGSSFFKKQAQLYLTRYYRNLGWSSIKNARNHKRDINRSRIAAACEEHDMKYGHFVSTLPKIDINLDLFALSRLAIYEPQTFKSLVDIAREATDTQLDPANFNPNTVDSKEDIRAEFEPAVRTK